MSNIEWIGLSIRVDLCSYALLRVPVTKYYIRGLKANSMHRYDNTILTDYGYLFIFLVRNLQNPGGAPSVISVKHVFQPVN